MTDENSRYTHAECDTKKSSSISIHVSITDFALIIYTEINTLIYVVCNAFCC